MPDAKEPLGRIVCTRTPSRVAEAARVKAALPEGARWALLHAQSGSAWVTHCVPEDLASGIAWGVVEKTPGGRKFRMTDLGKAIVALERTDA